MYIASVIAIALVLRYIFHLNDTSSNDDDNATSLTETIQSTNRDSLKMVENNNQVQPLHQQVTAILHKLGFKVEETENDLSFIYEGIHMLIMFTSDTNYLGILVPGILDVDENNELSILRVVEKVNNQLKYIKAFLPNGNSLWLSYERQLYTNEKISDGLIETMITGLANAYSAVGYFMNENEDTENGKD